MAKTAVVVVDMQNDFGSKGGLFDRAGLDISMIQKAVGPTARVLASARDAGIKVIYLGDIPSFCSGVVRMNFSAQCNCILIAIFSNGYISQVCLFQPFAHSTLIRSVVAGIRFCS